MTDAEWIESLRQRTHELANVLQRQEVLSVRFDERLNRVEDRMTEISELRDDIRQTHETVVQLRHDSKVLRWFLGALSTIGIGVLIKVL